MMGLTIRASRGRRRKKKILPFLLLALMFTAAAADYLYYRDRVYPGVYVKQVHLGGKTSAEVQEMLAGLQMEFTGPGGKTACLPLGEMGITVAGGPVIAEARRCGRQGGLLRAYFNRLRLIKDKPAIPLLYRLDEARLQQKLDSLEEIFNSQPRDAYFEVDAASAKAILIPEQPGFRVMREELYRSLLHVLNAPGLPLALTVPGEILPAQLTAFSLKDKGITGLISSFTTNFDINKVDRVHNLKLAASVINGSIVPPGEVFSVNAVVGNTTPEKGYRQAPVIVGTELVPGYGGGLCQISSTLYNAALLANLEIVERHNHNLTVPYLPPGRDATISYGTRDLKFRNNTGRHLLIYGRVEGDALTFWLLGTPQEERVEINTVKLEVFPPPERYELDPTLPPGEEEIEEGYAGYTVEVWKTVYRGDQIIAKEKISVDHYEPYPTVIRRGPAR